MFYPGQRIIARDGAQYVLACFIEGIWLGWPIGGAAPRAGGASLPRPVEPKYPAWGGDDERAGADAAA